MTSFQSDLQQEKVLTQYLDTYYHTKGYSFERIIDYDQQHKGIDIIFYHNQTSFNIDEKAQLHYLNKDLPTFTFELSYIKGNVEKQGWLFDERKTTHYYFLITAIFLKNQVSKLTKPEDIESLKIISVNRNKLIALLSHKSLSFEKLTLYNDNLRLSKKNGRITLPELNPSTEGVLYVSKQLVEQPINIQLRLQFLILNKIGKEI